MTKIIQISTIVEAGDAYLVALCDNGTIWRRLLFSDWDNSWVQIPT